MNNISFAKNNISISHLAKVLSSVVLMVLTISAFSTALAREDVAPTGAIRIENTVVMSNGKKAIGTRDVTLSITASDSGSGVSRIAVANENDISQINWFSWTDSRLSGTGSTKTMSWTLTEGDGWKTVWLIIEDGDSNTSATYNDAYRYTITYDAKGGSGAPNVGRKEVGKPYTISSTIPTKSGYDCMGWDTNSAGSTIEYVGGDKYYKNADATMYAVWYKNYTIVFNGNGNTGGSTANQHMTYSIAKNLNANGFIRTGYTFNKWNTQANGGGTSYNNQQSVNNLTSTAGGTVNLYAQWNPITYTIAYNNGTATGGSLPSNHTGVKYDQSISLGTNSMTKSNTNLGLVTFNYNGSGASNTSSYAYTTYSANGWATTSGGASVYTNGQSVKNLTTTNGGTVNLYPSFSTTANSATFPSASRTGYIFDGWYTASSGGSKVTSYTGSSNVTYYAHWSANSYTIAYNNGIATGGTLPTNHTGVKYDQNVTLGTNSMTKSNTNLGTVTFNYNGSGASNTTSTAYTTYSANGWATSSGGGRVYTNGQSVKNLTSTNGGTVNLYPSFSSTAHSATFPSPSRVGYTFAGWFTAASGGSQVTSYTGSSNVTYYAHWNVCSHSYGGWTTTTDATCTTAGSKYRTCSVCGYKDTQSIAALGHNYGGWTTTVEPTCNDAGSESRTCSRCSAKETQSIAALGHDWTAWGDTSYAVPYGGSATYGGVLVDYRHCRRCNAWQWEARSEH